MSLLKLSRVSKFYKLKDQKPFKALSNINLSFEKGELVSVVGESGSGKSTFMNLIGGLDSDYEGDIYIEGVDIKNYSEKELDNYRKNKIGFIFQSFNLIPHLNVLDNVTIALTLSNISKKKKIRRAKKILKSVGLKEHMYKKPNQLSGGMKQRVAIARALINEPEIILADEPTGALDSKTSEQILEIIKEISSQGKLIIMVTHSEKVSSISSRIVRIDDGKIIGDERKREVEEILEIEEKPNKGKQNLSFLSAIKLSLNNMRQKLSRNILVSIGASIGIMSVILMLSIGNGVTEYIVDTMNENTNPKLVEVNKGGDFSSTEDRLDSRDAMLSGEVLTFTAEEIEDLSNLENVESFELGYSITNFIDEIKFGEEVINVQSLMTFNKGMLENGLELGEMPNAGEILISPRLANKFSEENEKLIGQTISFTHIEKGERISGQFIISGIYEMGTPMSIVYINYSDLKNMYNDALKEINPSTVYLYAVDIKYTDELKETIAELGYTGSMADQIIDMFTEILDVVSYVLAGIAGISLFVSAIMILVVLYISVVERTSEIGVLKAIGARRKDIKRIFTTEAFLIGLAGGIFGVLGAYLIKLIGNRIVYNLFEVNIILIDLEFILFGIAISIIISVLAGLMPSSKAARLDPIESLRHE